MSKIKKIILVIIIGIIVIFIYKYKPFIEFLKNFNLFKKQSTYVTTPSEPSLEMVSKTILKEASVLNFPAVTNQKDISASLSNLPKELNYFIKPEAQDLIIQDVEYENNSKGFYVKYNLLGTSFESLYDEFRQISRRSDWKILKAVRTNIFAIREIETSIYKVRISQSLNDDKSITIVIEALIK
jgi:hypothetical protein